MLFEALVKQVTIIETIENRLEEPVPLKGTGSSSRSNFTFDKV